MKNLLDNPYYRDPDHPNFNRRAFHHDYTRPARYLITLLKHPAQPPFSAIRGNPYSKEKGAIAVSLSRTGLVTPEAIDRWQQKYPIRARNYAVMPDHLHICAEVYDHLPNNLSRAVANLMGMISNGIRLSEHESHRPPEPLPAFTKGFNDRIAYTEEQWQRQLHYTADNPRRYLIKKLHPDYLLKRWILTLPDGRQFTLRGNIFLLQQPQLFRVKTSRSFTPTEADEATARWKTMPYNGAIPVSPFIHPHERAFRDMVIDHGFSLIRICGNGFAEREAPVGREFELMSAGQLLHIAPTEFSTKKTELKYSFAQELNQLAQDIVDTSNSGAPMSLRQSQ